MFRLSFILVGLLLTIGTVDAAQTKKRNPSSEPTNETNSPDNSGNKFTSSKYVFRGLVFGSAPTENMKATYGEGTKIGLPDNEKIVQTYTLNNETDKIGDLNIEKIIYVYFDSQLYEVKITAYGNNDTVDKMLENKFGDMYKKVKYKKDSDLISIATGAERISKTVLIPSQSLQIDVSKIRGGNLDLSSTTLTYVDTQIEKTVRKLAIARDKYDKNKEQLDTERKIKNSKDQI